MPEKTVGDRGATPHIRQEEKTSPLRNRDDSVRASGSVPGTSPLACSPTAQPTPVAASRESLRQQPAQPPCSSRRNRHRYESSQRGNLHFRLQTLNKGRRAGNSKGITLPPGCA